MYHFIGIKGAGMSSLAIIMKQLGYDVDGSDIDKHFFTETGLIKENIKFYPYNINNIKKGQIIVRGLSITEDNEELKAARSMGLEIIDYNEMVGRLTKKFKTICVSGCHGKTTTTAMISHVLNQLIGINYLIGDGTGNANINNTFFALESCEYKRHFLAYYPYYTIILNVDLDHVDYFKDISDVMDAYSEFASKTSKLIILNGDDLNIRKMEFDKPHVYFGLDESNDIRACNIEYLKDGTKFDVYINNILFGTFMLKIYGKHQLMDALATIAVCYYENISSTDIANCFKTFSGAKRRFSETIVGNNIIIDDYAHHPEEVSSTINAIRQKYPDKAIIAIFQPHTYSRTEEFASDLSQVFSTVDKTYIMDIHPAREKQEDFPNVNKKIIIDKTKNCYPITIEDANILNEDDNSVFIFMSPNDISKLENDLINLKKDKMSS